MADIKSYDQAARSRSPRVWPGCGGTGVCRPCGLIHDFGYQPSFGPYVHKFHCWQNHQLGCPYPTPPPQHSFADGRCDCCGQQERWIASDGRMFSTIREAKRAGVRRSDLHREGAAPQSVGAK